jgi:hypothetical protein
LYNRQADLLADGVLDATGTLDVNPARLAQALADAEAELAQPGPWPH